MLLHKVTKFYRFVSICSLQKQFLRFSSLFATRDVSQEVTSVTQRQKFHPDDANQCLHNKSSSHGVPNTNLSNFTCLLVDFGKVLYSSANESSSKTQMLLLEKIIFHKY